MANPVPRGKQIQTGVIFYWRQLSIFAILYLYGHNVAIKTLIKPLRWVASSKKDLMAMPEEVRDVFGFALHLAQMGQKHPDAKPLKGFGGAGVLEVVEDFQGDAYRAVYTVRIAGEVFVLHCFQKKSTQGITIEPCRSKATFDHPHPNPL
ncbi:MAG: type II toxin-antitoxin system RelE/ParE family toxin, partial [Methylococcaceae bacterium]